MKILFAYNSAQYLYMFRFSLMESFRNDGHEVVFIAPCDDYAAKLTERGFRHISIRVSRDGKNPVKDILLMLTLAIIYRKELPDLVFQFTPKINIYGSIAASLSGTRVINTVTGLGYAVIKGGVIAEVAFFLYRFSFRYAEKVFFQNNDDKQLFLERNIVFSKKTSVVGGSGVDTDFFYPEYPDRIENSDSKCVLFAGRVLRDKGIYELVSAIRNIKKRDNRLKFRVVGAIDCGNPAGVSLREILGWQSEGVLTYSGFVEDIRPYLKGCDVLVLPSYREGLSHVIIEAMAMAKPVITTDVPGCKDAIDDGVDGFIVPPRNKIALEKTILHFFSLTKEERRVMGERGRNKVLMKFNQKKVVSIYKNAVYEMLGDR